MAAGASALVQKLNRFLPLKPDELASLAGLERGGARSLLIPRSSTSARRVTMRSSCREAGRARTSWCRRWAAGDRFLGPGRFHGPAQRAPAHLGPRLRRRDDIVVADGDEFGSCCHGASPRYTAGIAIRLCELLAARPVVLRGDREISERITLSIGVAGWQAGESSAGWYARADVALYEAKRRGSNRVSIARLLELKL